MYSWQESGRRRRSEAVADVGDFRLKAKDRLPQMVFDYIDGAAGRELTARRNQVRLQNIELQADILCDVSRIDMRSELFGRQSSLPIIVGPTGLNGAYWRRGDACLARAAKAADIPFVMSTAACITLDQMSQEAGPLRWFQLYMLKDRGLVQALLERVWQSGFEVLQLTVDTPVGGRRCRDIRNGFSMPFHWTASKLMDAMRHPRWTAQMVVGGSPNLELFAEVAGTVPKGSTITEVMNQQLSASFSWSDLSWLRAVWPGKLVLKGVSTVAQAQGAKDGGADGIVVSNHGGRQLDGVAASIDCLPEIVQAVGGVMTILIDSGFRTGQDVAKALALGADGVQFGRAMLYALAAGGEPAVRQAIGIIASELRSAMALTGSIDLKSLRGKCMPGRRACDVYAPTLFSRNQSPVAA